MRYDTPPFELGETLDGTDSDSNLINLPWLGQVFFHPASRLNVSQIRGSKSRFTGKGVTAVILRNTSGIALLPKRIVRLAFGTAGFAAVETASGYSHTLMQERLAIVDEFLPSAGVADDDIFWGIIGGPVLVTNSATAGVESNIVVGTPLHSVTAANSTHSTTAGRVRALTLPGQTGATQAFSAAQNLIGWALSARTTDETNTDLLIDACIKY